jgi:hypothetical protein
MFTRVFVACVNGPVAKLDDLSESKAREIYKGAEDLARHWRGRHLRGAALRKPLCKLLDVVGGSFRSAMAVSCLC